MKPVASFAVAGIVGLFALKFLGLIVLPIAAAFLAFVFIIVKLAIVVGLVWVAYRLFFRPSDRPATS